VYPLRPCLPACLQKEFLKVSRLTGIGFVAVGLIGFLVKVIFIPINQVGAGAGWWHWPARLHCIACLPACVPPARLPPCLFAPACA
jgi:hypothetical protein